jgi:hypothetical protein
VRLFETGAVLRRLGSVVRPREFSYLKCSRLLIASVARRLRRGLACARVCVCGGWGHVYAMEKLQAIIEDIIRLRHEMKPYFSAQLDLLNATGTCILKPRFYHSLAILACPRRFLTHARVLCVSVHFAVSRGELGATVGMHAVSRGELGASFGTHARFLFMRRLQIIRQADD